MLKSQIAAQGEAFEQTGGFSEFLTTRRLAARESQREAGPTCPQCEQPMRRRRSAKGDFWGCSGFPECKGTRPIENR
jgi:ribosomal protein L37AE/L43A